MNWTRTAEDAYLYAQQYISTQSWEDAIRLLAEVAERWPEGGCLINRKHVAEYSDLFKPSCKRYIGVSKETLGVVARALGGECQKLFDNVIDPKTNPGKGRRESGK